VGGGVEGIFGGVVGALGALNVVASL